MDEIVYDVARYVGLPGETLTRFVGALEACGYTIAKKAVSRPEDQAALAQRPEERKSPLAEFVSAQEELPPDMRDVLYKNLWDLYDSPTMNNGEGSKNG